MATTPSIKANVTCQVRGAFSKANPSENAVRILIQINLLT